MTKFLLGLFILLTGYVNAQDSLQSYSYYFNTNTCATFSKIDGFDKTNYFGRYKLMENERNQMRVTAGDDLVIDENGVYISKNKLLSISREEVRENSKYRVKNGYLHGILANDSLPTFLQDESYYFLMPTRAFLFDVTVKNQTLYKINTSTFMVFTKENNGFYSVLKINIKSNKITLSELDLTYNQVDGLTYKLTTENGIKTYLLTPTKQQWQFILTKFVVYDKYVLKE